MSLSDLLAKATSDDERNRILASALGTADLFERMMRTKALAKPTNSFIAALAQRFERLYYPTTITTGGADTWPEGAVPGRVHLSLNEYHVYVDIPASLQAVPPIESIVPIDPSDPESRAAADAVEAIYLAWKRDEELDLKDHLACIVKALYGYAACKVWWDDERRVPRVEILEQPTNLYVEWGSSNFRRMEACVYIQTVHIADAKRRYGVDLELVNVGDTEFPVPAAVAASPSDLYRRTDVSVDTMLSRHALLYDYWYRDEDGVPINVLFLGPTIVHTERHEELPDLPYLILPNTFIPGWPYGRSELHDLEQLLREKSERLSELGQLIHASIEGQRFQLVGPNAPVELDDRSIPGPGEIATPGPGNEIRPIVPHLPEMQAADYIRRLDAEIETVTGLNDVLIGRAPAAVLGSSRVISMLMAQYGARIRVKRDLFYRWRRSRWELAAKIWAAKDRDIREIFRAGGTALLQTPPDLSPRDQLEIANMAMNLVNTRIWSMERAMAETGVENATAEKDLIRVEQTDAALQPAAAQAQLQLAAIARQLGLTPPSTSLGSLGQTYAAENQFNAPPTQEQALNQPENAPPTNTLLQTMLQGGQAKGRILTQSEVGLPTQSESNTER